MSPARTALLLLLLLTTVAAPVFAADGDAWVFAYRPGCGDCDRALPLVEAFRLAHPEQPIELLNLSGDPAATARFNALAEQHGARTGVPVIYAGDRVVQGVEPIRTFLAGRPAPTPTAEAGNITPLTPLVVASAGLVDGINPCAFAVLALLLGTLSASGSRRRTIVLGGAYTAGIFLCYLGAGLGIVTVVGAAGIASAFRLGAGVVALLLGLAVLLSAVLPDAPFRLAIPGRGRAAAGRWIPTLETAGPVAAFGLGVGLGLVELPCTGGVYLGVLGLLAGGSVADALPLLVPVQPLFRAPAGPDRRRGRGWHGPGPGRHLAPGPPASRAHRLGSGDDRPRPRPARPRARLSPQRKRLQNRGRVRPIRSRSAWTRSPYSRSRTASFRRVIQ